MTKFIAFTTIAVSSLLVVTGNANAGCGSRGYSGWPRAPAYQSYYYAPAPTAATGTGTTYRSFSYDPETVQPSYQYYAPRRYAAPSGANDFRAGRKIQGVFN